MLVGMDDLLALLIALAAFAALFGVLEGLRRA
jgi:hypothetical protein